MTERSLNLLVHYRKLWLYNWHRHEANNMTEMRRYFTHILIGELEAYMALQGKTILDVGGARGEFCQTLHELREMFAVNLDPKLANPQFWPEAVSAYADNIPFPDGTFDVAISRGVFEHIPQDRRQDSLNEMYRVTKPGGLGYILIPPWFNPHAGHGFKPFHYFPFPVAKFLRRMVKRRMMSDRVHSYNDAGLHPLTFRGTIDLINRSGFKLLDTKDTHFRLHFLTRIWPANELLVPAVAFILQKPPASAR
jgi:ubiquinone/menaquinone biosynthesis C-methylase UbiE